jgi:hypothetical protein
MICFIIKMDDEFVRGVFDVICGSFESKLIIKTFDNQSREGIVACVSELLARVEEVDEAGQIPKFRQGLGQFKGSIQKYAINLTCIPEFYESFGEMET